MWYEKRKIIVWYMHYIIHETTVFFLFELEQCVEHAYKLNQYTRDISEKFKYFVSFLRQNCITNKRNAANNLNKIYDKNSIIKCELVELVKCELIVYSLNCTCCIKY